MFVAMKAYPVVYKRKRMKYHTINVYLLSMFES